MIKTYLTSLFLTLIVGLSSAQNDYLEFSENLNKISETEYQMVLTLDLKEGYHVNSKDVDPNSGLIPVTTAYLADSTKFKLIGELKEEGKRHKEYSDLFETDWIYIENKAVYTQKVEILSKDLQFIELEFGYQVCDATSCFAPETLGFKYYFNGAKAKTSTSGTKDLGLPAIAPDLVNPIADCGGESAAELSNKTDWEIFGLGFIGGLLAILMPCVFPMIPLTVSFFTKGGTDSKKGIMNALLYGFFIILIYALLSIPFHLLDNISPNILNDISTNPILNIIFFIVFIIFSISFFGYFELTLPSSFTNKASSGSSSGGWVGIFFMALTLAIVSFSCTGPILGVLLAGALSQGGAAMGLTLGMVGFGVALALPFALFATFPNLLKSMPKSGGWLNTVKVVLGFLELALALKFLSKADLVNQWGLLKREVFLGIWVIIFVIMIIYLLGFIKFPHDTKEKFSFKNISLGKWVMIGLSVFLIVGIVPGLQGKTSPFLKAIAGFPPPVSYSIYSSEEEHGSHENDPLSILKLYTDFDKGWEVAKAQNKPILIDFTGHGCENCRRMEENVWVLEDVLPILKDEYIIISLYVDDKRDLPKEQQFEFENEKGLTKKIRTIGDKWATFEAEVFKASAQPYYILLNNKGELLNNPLGGYNEKEIFKAFLECGLKANQK